MAFKTLVNELQRYPTGQNYTRDLNKRPDSDW